MQNALPKNLHPTLQQALARHVKGSTADLTAFITDVNKALTTADDKVKTLELRQNAYTKEANNNLEKRLAHLLENTEDIITVISTDGIIQYESPNFYNVFGYSPNEIIGQNGFPLVHPDDLAALGDNIGATIANPGVPAQATFRYKHKQGHYIWLEVVGKYIKDDVMDGIVVTNRVVTDRVEKDNRIAEYTKKLEKINKELDQFAYIISHDLKAPLRAIANLSVWIEEDLGDAISDDTQTNFNLVRQRIKRMEDLINGVLDYSRAGRNHTELEELNSRTIVNDAVAMVDLPAHVNLTLADALPTVKAQKTKLTQVFTNFISNAIKYNNNPAPTIHINYSSNATHHIFSVEDNGPGISADNHEKVFQMFITLQARDKVESTGVGLTIVKKIVEDAGGTTWVESELGQGAKFFFSLPK